MTRLLALAVLGTLLLSPTPASAADDRVVETRASTRGGSPVLNKFFVKARRFEIDAPIIGYLSNNPFISDLTLGFGLAYHIDERVAVELMGSYGVLGFLPDNRGARFGFPSESQANFKKIVDAAVGLVSQDDFRLETVDPELMASVSALWSPMYGKINPFGLAVINLDFFFYAGAGILTELVKMAKWDRALFQAASAEGIGLQRAVNDPNQQRNKLSAQVNLGGGLKIYITRSFALRIDARFMLTLPRVPDYKDPENAAMNREFEEVELRPPNRQDCGGGTQAEAGCTRTLQSTFVVSISPSFWVPKAPARSKATLIRR
jgi:outer membrane beta-barrel protein